MELIRNERCRTVAACTVKLANARFSFRGHCFRNALDRPDVVEGLDKRVQVPTNRDTSIGEEEFTSAVHKEDDAAERGYQHANSVALSEHYRPPQRRPRRLQVSR